MRRSPRHVQKVPRRDLDFLLVDGEGKPTVEHQERFLGVIVNMWYRPRPFPADELSQREAVDRHTIFDHQTHLCHAKVYSLALRRLDKMGQLNFLPDHAITRAQVLK